MQDHTASALHLRNIVILLSVLGLHLPYLPWCHAAGDNTAEPWDETHLFQEIPSVFGASKYEQKVTEAPSAVTILTSEDIQRYGYRTLGEALLSVRGFYQSYDRAVARVGVRGFGTPGDSNSRLLLLLDGQRTNDSIFGSGHISSFDIVDVDLVDRIEFIRGPGSSLYGTSAFFSVINIITKRGRDYGTAEISGQVGSQDRYMGRLTYGTRLPNNIEALFSANYTENSGNENLYFEEFDAPATNNGIVEDLDGMSNFTLFSKISLFDFTLEGVFLKRDKEVPGAPYGVKFNEPGTEAESIVGHLNLKYEHLFTNQLEFETNLTLNTYEETGDYVYEGPITNRDEFRGSWFGADFQLGKRLERHRLIFGGEYRNNYRQDQKNYDLGMPALFESRESSGSWGVYLQEEYRFRENFIINLGLRHDHYDSFGGTTNPRIALIHNPFEDTTLKLLYGRAFRAPNAFERFYSDGNVSSKSNPDLDPETIDTFEFVWEQNLGRSYRGVATAFYYQIDDLITLTLDDNDGLVVYQNIGEVEAVGGEIEFEGSWNNFLEGRISYSYQRVEDRITGERVANSPLHMVKLNLSFPVYQDKIYVSIEEQYTGERKTVEGNTIGGSAITHLTLLARNLTQNLTLSASVFNLFDKEYRDPVSQALLQETMVQDGRSFNFKVSYRF